MTYGTLVCSHQPSLQQRDHSVHPRQYLRSGLSTAGNNRGLPWISFGVQAGVALPIVRVQGAAGINAVQDKRMEALGFAVLYSTHSDSPDPRCFTLHSDHHHRFPDHPTTRTALFGSSDKGLVDLDVPLETVASRGNHGATQLVQPSPRGLVASETKDSLNRHRTGPGFRPGQIPHRPKPRAQRFARTLEDRPGPPRALITAVPAHYQSTLRRPALLSAASATNKTLRPPKAQQIGFASRFATETRLEFRLISRIIFHNLTYYM